MNHSRVAVRARVIAVTFAWGLTFIAAGLLLTSVGPSIAAQTAQAAPQAASGPVHLEVTSGSTASYRVQEQLAGISFPSEAVGTTDSVAGTIVLAPDGSVDSSQSKLTVDLRTLKSDQDLRDNYIRTRTFEVDKFPMAEFVLRRVTGLASPLPITGQSGFQMIGDLTVHGTTKEVTWNGIITFTKDGAAGRAMTDFTFATFGLTKPTLARLLSVGDKIALEVEFRTKRT